jgi:F0F1-type ATP synthase membrane subunit b/b'
MDTLLSVLVTLGVDKSIWIQFALTVAFLILARMVFVNDLLKVLSERVVNTSGAADEAEKLTQEAEIAKKRYEKILNEKILVINNEYTASRKKIKDEIDSDYKSKEEKLISAFKNEISKKQSEFTKAQDEVEKNTAELSTELLAKIKQ